MYYLSLTTPPLPLPFPTPLPRGVVFPPLPRVLLKLAWLGALLTEYDNTGKREFYQAKYGHLSVTLKSHLLKTGFIIRKIPVELNNLSSID